MCNSSKSKSVCIAALIIFLSIAVEAHASTPSPAPNPILPSSCGIDMVLIVDSSGSINNAELTQMKNAFNGFVDAFLPNTPTRIAVVDFDTVARLTQGYSTDKTAIKSAIGSATSGGSTNWQDALTKAYNEYVGNSRAGKPDLFILASDGNPNMYGNPAHGTGSDVDPNALSAAIATANSIKSSGVRIITLGIGDDLKPWNLKAISSDDAYYSTNFDVLAQTLAGMASDLCGGTISVKKLVNGQAADGWAFTTSVTGGTSDPFSGVTDESGFIVFDISGATPTVDVTETQKDGYDFVSAQCKKGGQVVGTSGAGTVTGIPVGDEDVIYCEFQNACSPDNHDDPRCFSCGNDIVEGTEVCDGGLQTCSVDGYSGMQTCKDDCSGWNACSSTQYCGDGIVNGNETCDDNNTISGDGCSDVCQIEQGYSCIDQPSNCTPVCGDGIVTSPETCDDNNTVSGDGCSSICQIETGYNCSSNPSNCTPICNTSCLNGGVCTAPDTCSCASGWYGADCSQTQCGDSSCNNGETCSSCPADCGACSSGGGGGGGGGVTFSGGTLCTENWTCADWSTCQGGVQARNCTDSNKCNTIKNRPNLTQSCTVSMSAITCVANWTCADWTACVNGSQSRTCEDLNNCGTAVGKPSETQSCTPLQSGQISPTGFFLGLSSFDWAAIISLLAALVMASLYVLKKKKLLKLES